MKYIKTFEHNNKFEYGDYIIYKRINWKNETLPLMIMSICGTPGPLGTKFTYYTVNVLYELIDDELKYNTNWDPLKIEQDVLEQNALYHTRTLEDAKYMIFIINDGNKYNL